MSDAIICLVLQTGAIGRDLRYDWRDVRSPKYRATSRVMNPTGMPKVAIIMGSQNDWDTLRHASDILTELDIPHENRVVSAHRTPDFLFEYVSGAEARGIQAIIAGAGGAAHLPGMAASKTLLPVLGVPVMSRTLQGMDSLLSIVQMPKGIPVGTLAIGEAGAANAALLAAQILALSDESLKTKLQEYRTRQTQQVLDQQL